MTLIGREFLQNQIQYAYRLYQTKVGIKKISNTGNTKNRYGDVKVTNYESPIYFYGTINIRPSEAILKELGWELNDVEAIIRVPTKELQDVGLMSSTGSLNFNMNSLITYGGKDLEICDIHNVTPFLDDIQTYVFIGGRNINGRN